MSIEVKAIQQLAKGMRLRPVFEPKKAVNEDEKTNKKENKKSNKPTNTTQISQPEAKKENVVLPKGSSQFAKSKIEVPFDMKPTPIGLSNTSNLPAVNLSGVGVRSRQFKGQ